MNQKTALMVVGGIALIGVAAYLLMAKPVEGISAQIVSVEVT